MVKEKNPHAVALSKLGAKKGGKTRAAALSADRRREIARKASLARWAKEKKKTEASHPDVLLCVGGRIKLTEGYQRGARQDHLRIRRDRLCGK